MSRTSESDRDYDLVIAALDGRGKADDFFNVAKAREADGAFRVKGAAIFAAGLAGAIRGAGVVSATHDYVSPEGLVPLGAMLGLDVALEN